MCALLLAHEFMLACTMTCTKKLRALIRLCLCLRIRHGGHLGGITQKNIHLMSAREGNSFVFPRVSMFPETKETLRLSGKQNYFPRKQTLSVLLYRDKRNITTLIQQLYFMPKSQNSIINEFKIKRNLLKLFVSRPFCLFYVHLLP